MTTTKHTPGPWTVLPGITSGDIITPMGRVASCVTLTTDAALIAATPALLEACEDGDLDWYADRLVNVYGESENVDFVLALRRKAAKERAAIKLARGEP